MSPANFQQLSNFLWSVAEMLRGPYRPNQYERIMLPMVVLRRLDCVLEASKQDVLNEYKRLKQKKVKHIDRVLNLRAKDENGQPLGFHNHSDLDFQKLKGDPDNVAKHMSNYINGFSENIRTIFEYFDFEQEIERLEFANRLYQIVSQFSRIDLHPNKVDNITMGLVFEDLIRRFNEAANETAGDHFTPREVIHLMVNLLMSPDNHVLTKKGIIITVCDPACGTGGMLSEARNWIRAHNESAIVRVFGQDYNPRSYAVSASDLLIKGFKDSRIELGNTLIDDKFTKHPEHQFDYLLANPPFGVDWKPEQMHISREPNFRGYRGKLPRVNDGALMFLVHMISKFRPYMKGDKSKTGSRAAIIFNGSPLFSGGAGSGESEIRRWIIENDWLEAIIALPEQMFYNTGIATYIWILSNCKIDSRKGKIQLIDARSQWTQMKRTLGKKRRYLSMKDIEKITSSHGVFKRSKQCKIYDNEDFGYRRIIIQRPLRLKFQITQERMEIYLNVYPELLDAVQDLEMHFGSEPYYDWNETWALIQRIVKESKSPWTKGAMGAAQRKAYRQCFTEVDPGAEPVIAKRSSNERVIRIQELLNQPLPKGVDIDNIEALFGFYLDECNDKLIEFEADPKLKDFENVPWKESIVSYFLSEVQPYLPDAWIDSQFKDEQDECIGKVGYEINFNREFYQPETTRPLKDIDADLKQVENRILNLLQEVAV